MIRIEQSIEKRITQEVLDTIISGSSDVKALQQSMSIRFVMSRIALCTKVKILKNYIKDRSLDINYFRMIFSHVDIF